MSTDEMKALLEQLQAENDKLKKAKTVGISMKVSEKGALSLYGVGRFPVTLYREQWVKVLAMKEKIEAFMLANAAQLKTKE